MTSPTSTTGTGAVAGAGEPPEPLPAHDQRRVRSATGLLAGFNDTGLLEAADVHVARRVSALAGEDDEQVQLALALAVRGVRSGSVCVDLAAAPALLEHAGWPDPAGWVEAVAASPLVDQGVLHLEDGTVYLDRYHRLESQVCDDLVERVGARPPVVDAAALDAARARIRGDRLSEQQERAAVGAVGRWTTVLTGGPGTGKTTTIARLLVLLADQAAARGERFSVALTAPTGKAATRLQEAVLDELAGLDPADRERVGRPEAMTLHRLLGWRPDNATRFRHHRGNRLKHDLVVVDESSMVELTMMGRLLEAVRPQARLVLVGDPRQLTSVGAGAVLADVVRGFGDHFGEGTDDSPVASLTENFRSTEDIKQLAEALRAGDADEVLATLRRPSDEVELVELPAEGAVAGAAAGPSTGEVLSGALRQHSLDLALRVRRHAVAGEHELAVAALDDHRLLCAHRDGPYGVRSWNRQVERWLADDVGEPVLGQWYVGRPLLVTTNDYALEVYNGETGAVVRAPDGRLRAWISGSERLRDFSPARLEDVETMHAMTVHKSQGSQAAHVTVLLPEADSRLLTRELFYTAITRAQQQVRVVASEAAVRAAVAREAQRASGLRDRLARRLAAADRARHVPATHEG
ncbi:exodeoxyribonuclease V alpha subunit [Nocardioides marinisabuli]|uniref:RecBCD enzyme subunit RecD n=1 Tax=Nocardioides marinisabuli TaxID=419476 RepID=A0A7Y9F0A4_9ACTN|nr:exodeoxyribonuclease V subunit alpha [Nocardioides marinisabuli]NYD57252.1 exodeoxyribonuclease V alpha subunit [Nocardioides marinisabuli]